jgi:dihydroorotase
MILLKNVTVICQESSWHRRQCDIKIENGVIKEIGENLGTQTDAHIIDHKNLHVSIGWFDSSVCFGEPGFEERQNMENGLTTAALSGFTTIMLNPNNQPNPQDASGIKNLKSITASHIVNVLPVGNLTLDQQGKHLAELYDMQQSGAVSFYDFKKGISNPNLLKLALQYTAPFHGVVQSYPQDDAIAGNGMVDEDATTTTLGLKTIPSMAESVRIARDLQIAAYTGNHLHIPTVSTLEGLRLIEEAKTKDINVTSSVSIANFSTATSALLDYDTNFKIKPPLRDTSNVDGVLEYLNSGVVDLITSDHVPLTIESKNVEFDHADYGSIGLESCFGLSNLILGLDLTVQKLTAGYKVFKQDVPTIEEESRANITLFDPTISHQLDRADLNSTSKNCMFIDRKLLGKSLGIIVGDKIEWYGGK